MTGFLFLLAALAVLGIVATLHALPIDGLRAKPVDAALLQRLRDRHDRVEALERGPQVLASGLDSASGGIELLPLADPVARDGEHVASGRRPMRGQARGIRHS